MAGFLDEADGEPAKPGLMLCNAKNLVVSDVGLGPVDSYDSQSLEFRLVTDLSAESPHLWW